MEQQPEESLPISTDKQPIKSKQKRPMSSRASRIIFAIVVISGSFLTAFGGTIVGNVIYPRQSSTITVGSGEDGNNVTTTTEQDVASAAEKVSPSVVSILTETEAVSYYDVGSEGAGTGVIVSADGYIMTNKHVVDGVSTVSIVTADGKTYDDVKVVATDPLNDIAFLKIGNVTGLKPVELGNSSTIRIGQSVVAIGNSLGQYQNTVTSGIISGTNRPVSAQSGDEVESLTDLIQTDAAINLGNSGGPLINMAGQVIGINTAIASDAQGIGFTIPINATKGMLKGLLQNGVAKRAYLGVSYIPITPEVASQYKLSISRGAYVFDSANSSAVSSGGPADKAGIQNKDIITSVNGVEVGTKGGVASLIGEYAPGEQVEIVVLRAGKEMKFTVTLEAYPGS